MTSRFEIRERDTLVQPYARNGNVGQQKPVKEYLVYEVATGKPVSSPLRRLKDAKQFVNEMERLA